RERNKFRRSTLVSSCQLKEFPLPFGRGSFHQEPELMAEKIKSKTLARFVNALEAAHADNLSSVTVYGSTAQDDGNAGAKHDVLVVLGRLELEDLRRAVEPIRDWTRGGQPMPVYFSLDELR